MTTYKNRAPRPTYPQWLKARQLIFISLCALALLLIHFRFFVLQVPQHELWKQKAKRQHLVEHTLIAKRGCFKSATTLYAHHLASGYSFNKEMPVYHLFVDTTNLTSYKRAVIEEFLFPFAKDPLQLAANLQKKNRSRRILSYLSPKEYHALATQWTQVAKQEQLPKNLLFFLRDFARNYPHGETLGYLLQAVAQYKDPLSHYIQPVGGLELLFNKDLTGTAGKLQLARTLKNPFLYQEEFYPPQDGKDIYLSIHPQLQAYCEKVLACGIERHRAKSGWCVVADCDDGQILALAQFPRFDPSRYGSYYANVQELWKTRVWSIQDAFEPGSIFKPLFMTIALKANHELQAQGKPPLFDPEKWCDLKAITLKGRKTGLKDTSFARYANMNLALKKSSNLYTAALAQGICDQLGSAWLAKEIRQLGFGAPTGVQFPAEAHGLLPQPGKRYPNGTLQWSALTPHSISMGYNVLVSSMQLVQAYCILANGGHTVTPSIILKAAHEEPKNRSQIIATEICDRVLQGMAHVTDKGGSGARAQIHGYSEGGKSGTAHKIRGGKYDKSLFLASFVGIVPLKKPRFVILVSYDEPLSTHLKGHGFNHRGSFCSAPSFALIARETLRTFNIAPDDPTGYSEGDARSYSYTVKQNQNVDEDDSIATTPKVPKPFLFDESRQLNEKFKLLHPPS